MFGWFEKRKAKKAIHTQVLGLIKAGKKVNAIKAYRTYSGLGLKESKAFVDHLADTM